jgi:hypothetical protein
MSDNGNEPAWPIHPHFENGNYVPGSSGLTKREWMAAMCLQGLLARNHSSGQTNNVEWAVNYADALLAELAKGGE